MERTPGKTFFLNNFISSQTETFDANQFTQIWLSLETLSFQWLCLMTGA
jgi:hypothetical protein